MPTSTPSPVFGNQEFHYTREDFQQVRERLYRLTGISLAESKAQLVYSRLSRRLRLLRLGSFAEYFTHLDREPGEQQLFVNALTTNLTAFFRERHHFPLLADLARRQLQRHRPLRIWSAAASTGEEPYSIAITLVEALGSFDPPVKIVASDIDTGVLDCARQGVYPLERLEQMPAPLKKRFFLRGTGPNAGKARVVEELRQLVEFRQINLLEADWSIAGELDAIFCRNVMIYFDKPTQTRLLERMVALLRPEGLFFAGHSENFVHASHLGALRRPDRLQPGLIAMNLQAREGAPLNRYYDPYFACDAVKLLPGEYFASGEDLVIVTVLGSCVSVCLRDPLNGIAGMNHFMLPERGLGGDPASPSARYGSHAMELLINRMLALGASRERLQAKVFGGGSVLRQISAAIGQRNVEFTLDYLATERIPLLASDVLEAFPRKIYFFPRNGRVLVKSLVELKNDTVLQRERDYRRRIDRNADGGPIDLF